MHRTFSSVHPEYMQIGRGEGIVLEDDALRRFRDDGFALLSDAFPPHELAAEIDAVFGEVSSEDPLRPGAGGVRFAFVPMMSEHTPSSTLLADALAGVAARAMGRPVLPGRAKGTTYFGESGWHRDSELDIPSVAFVAYLEPLRRGQGALELLPGSRLGKRDPREREPIALETRPGDIVVFDEHVTHGSRGGGVRRQWRVDFIADPRTDVEAELVARSFSQIFDPRWGGGYDVDRYPSFGAFWRSAHPDWSARLETLGVLEMASAYDAVIRERRNSSNSER